MCFTRKGKCQLGKTLFLYHNIFALEHLLSVLYNLEKYFLILKTRTGLFVLS